MMYEYYEWLKEHPDATEEEKDRVWNRCLEMLYARNAVINMLSGYRYM